MINRAAVLHIPLSQYAYAGQGGEATFRLRAARGNLERCTLYYGDRADRNNPVRFTAAPMRAVAADGLFEWFECRFVPGFERICYYFELCASGEALLYYADLFMPEPPAERSEFYQLPFMVRQDIYAVPDWFERAVVYNIFPDSFASGREKITPRQPAGETLENGLVCRSKNGGTLRGILENLDYIQQLGFSCVYLNPIFTAGEYHKYDIIDYYHIDPCFGTDAEFGRLVEALHQRGMAVIIDGVFNHCSWEFFAFRDVVEKGRSSQYTDWFYRLEYPVVRPQDPEAVPGYGCFAYERKMPKLNTANPEVQAYFLDVCRHWMERYHIDGWRLDVGNEVSRGFLRAFRAAAKAINPGCVVIGEVWESAESWLLGDMYDSTMNYDFRKNCRDFFALGVLDAAGFDARVTAMRMRYPESLLRGQLNLLDSHDVSRFLSLCGGDERRLKTAAVFLALAPGVPCVYYGDEKGVQGVLEDEYRRPMPWQTENAALVDFYRGVAALRGSFMTACTGGYETLCAEAGEGLYAFARQGGGQRLVAALNAGETPVALAGALAPLAGQKPLLAEGLKGGTLAGFGWAVWQAGA